MPRLTITLTAQRHRALKETAVRRGITITALIDECLELAGIRTVESAREIVARARAQAALTETQALDLALRQTRAHREERS